MKSRRILPSFLLVCGLAIAGPVKVDNAKKSRVAFFMHNGWGDSAYAWAEGNIVAKENGKTIKLQGVEVSAIDSVAGVVTTVLSDTGGNYEIGTPYGSFSLSFKLHDYETLLVRNYKSMDDMYSTLEVILEKGNDTQIYYLPDSLQFKSKYE